MIIQVIYVKRWCSKYLITIFIYVRQEIDKRFSLFDKHLYIEYLKLVDYNNLEYKNKKQNIKTQNVRNFWT